jgi:glycosyltransferase involved in cell wall biosynthesis
MAAGVPRRREGGVAAIVYNYGEELQRRGHKVAYVFTEDLIAPGSVSRRFSELIFALRLRRYIEERRGEFSVVNLHGPDGFPYGLRKKWSRGNSYPPYVMTLHGLEERRVHVMSREHQKGRAWHFSWKNRQWHRAYHFPRFRWSIRTADGVHTYSRDVWTMLQLKYNLDAERTAYIPNGVEARFDVPREYRASPTIRLLYPGTWLDQRGIFYIREALQRAAKTFPGLTLTVAGGGASADEVLGFFGSELAGKIVVLPVVAAGQMQQLYAEHDMLVFPSLMEGLPAVLLEAMASGMPVITAETCGMTDVVENEYNGLLVPPANAAALEEAIIRLASSVELRESLGTAARQTMRRYTWERSARQLEAFFYRTIEAHRARSRRGAEADAPAR